MLDAVIKKLPVVFVLGLVVGGGLGVSFGKHFFSWVDTASFEKRYVSLAVEVNAEKGKRLAAEGEVEKTKSHLAQAKADLVVLREQMGRMVTKEVYDKVILERDQAVSNYNELKKPYDARSEFFQKLQGGIVHPCTSDFLLYRTAMYSRERDNGDILVTSDSSSSFWVHAGTPQVVTIKDMYVQVRVQRDKQGCGVVFGVPPM